MLSYRPVICFAKRNRHRLASVAVSLAALTCSALFPRDISGKDLDSLGSAAELSGIGRWINSAPLSVASQKGKVVVLHFWTFGCINCRRNLPYYNKWRKDFAEDKVQIIGIHTPETAGEADLDNVATQIKKLGIKYPVAVDNDKATWDAYGNRFWPSIYLIDKRGQVRHRWDGELEYRNAGGDRILHAKIEELLSESDK